MAGRIIVPAFPAPSQDDMERVLTEDPSKANKNRVTLWNVKLSPNPIHSSQQVIMTKIEYESKKKGVKRKKKRITLSKADYKKLLALIKLAQSLKRIKLRNSPDEGIQDDRGLQMACERYHDFLKKNFSAPWHRGFLRELNLLKYDFTTA